MVYSMTGFGRAVCNLDTLALSIEVKSLNSKQLDLSCKLPFDFRDKELEIRNLAGSKLERGKIDIYMVYDQNNMTVTNEINENLLKHYYSKFEKISVELEVAKSDRLMLAALKMPDVISSPKIEINEEKWGYVKQKLTEAIDLCIGFREQEGRTIEVEMNERVRTITRLLKEVDKYEAGRSASIRQRITDNMGEFMDKKMVDENRFEQEILYYLEKIDISEEKARLGNHCSYFTETLGDAGQVGKKLNFITQEMGREINTLGSKANNFEIQRIVVQMKDELEKVKEQVLNIL